MDEMKDREITNVEVEGIDTRDYPEFCDAFISSADWADTGEALTDPELDIVNENSDLVHDYVWEALH